MATRTETIDHIHSDLSGEEIDAEGYTPLRWIAPGGQTLEVDVTDVEREAFRDLQRSQDQEVEALRRKHAQEMETYTKAARIVGRGAKAKRSRARSGATGETKAARAWAKEAGYDVKDQGRLDSAIIEAWVAAGRPGA